MTALNHEFTVKQAKTKVFDYEEGGTVNDMRYLVKRDGKNIGEVHVVNHVNTKGHIRIDIEASVKWGKRIMVDHIVQRYASINAAAAAIEGVYLGETASPRAPRKASTTKAKKSAEAA